MQTKKCCDCKVEIRIDDSLKPHGVSRYLLGHNLEMFKGAVEGLLTDRLENPKFAGPAHPTSGVADQWLGTGALIPGLGMSGDNAQRVDGPLSQHGRGIRKGEMLELEIWAKATHSPVEATIAIRGAAKRRPPYVSGTLAIDTAFYSKYTLELDIPVDDDSAVFSISTSGPGTLFLDQIHLRPSGAGITDAKVLDAFASLNISSLRFPGGCVTTVYRWKNGVGPHHLRPVHLDPQFHGRISYDFGTDEYLDFCLSNAITPQIVVNLGSQTETDAAEWANYCREFFLSRDVEPPMIFFQIGNEQFAAHSSAHMTGEMYVAALNRYVPPIKEAYPNSKIIAIGYPYSGATSLREKTPWRELVLDETHGLVDMISNHYYKGQWFDTFEEQQMNAVDSIKKIRDDFQRMITDIKQRGRNTKIAVTEWNYWLYADFGESAPDQNFHEPMDANHCLFVAGMLQMMAELGEWVEVSNFYHLINGLSVFNSFAGNLIETPLAAIFRFYSEAFLGEYYPLLNDSPLFVGEERMVSAMMIKRPGESILFIINFSTNENVELNLPDEFSGIEGDSLVFENPAKGKEVFAEHSRIPHDARIAPPCSILKFHKH